MTNLKRLKTELAEKQYYDDDTYSMYLQENGLEPKDEYDKATMYKRLLMTVRDILFSLSNDIDLFRKVETEFVSTTAALDNLMKRLDMLERRIAATPDDTESDGYSKSSWSHMFYTRKVIK